MLIWSLYIHWLQRMYKHNFFNSMHHCVIVPYMLVLLSLDFFKYGCSWIVCVKLIQKIYLINKCYISLLLSQMSIACKVLITDLLPVGYTLLYPTVHSSDYSYLIPWQTVQSLLAHHGICRRIYWLASHYCTPCCQYDNYLYLIILFKYSIHMRR